MPTWEELRSEQAKLPVCACCGGTMLWFDRYEPEDGWRRLGISPEPNVCRTCWGDCNVHLTGLFEVEKPCDDERPAPVPANQGVMAL